MVRCIVIGKDKSGKTIFCKNFSKFINPKNKKNEIFTQKGLTNYKISIKSEKIYLIDSVSIDSGIDKWERRRERTKTLYALIDANIIIHIIDATDFSFKGIDKYIIDYGITKDKYLILLNKTDKIHDNNLMKEIIRTYPKINIFNISAKKRIGFNNVKTCLRHMISCDKIHRKNYFGW
ncbi:MAG: GTPase RsgA [Anaeromicrobium sp.]|jgi:predicted GTPase|uniref:GTPase RsgA n=1 Tax=Anaeromicrobium sp. TaxID=1929132 RepID=UPI0025DA7F9F|nr:GTPase RsgA [Anaeromicrobium sp.]MCT4594724.1 GTPase RsgA [Anaeromicrobium sp.]